MKIIKEEKTIMNNNEELIKKGLYLCRDGLYLALTYTRSKYFKTLRGAEKWLTR